MSANLPGETYEQHMKRVDAYLLRTVGLDHDSGEDTPTRDRYEDGLSAPSHAAAILEDWGVFG